MKYILFLILTFVGNIKLFSQNKQIIEKDIKEITNYLKDDNLISFFKKHQSYRQLLDEYLKNGDTLRYKRMSDSSDYKYNSAMYGDNIIRNFLNCKKTFTVDDTKVKIDWEDSFVKEIFIEENRISIDENNPNQEMFVPVKVLISNAKGNKLIVNISLIYAKSGNLISFRILEDIHIGFSSIKEYVKSENEKKEKLLTDALQNGGRSRLKRIDNYQSDPSKQYQKKYISENSNIYKLIFTFETNDNTTLLRLVERITNGNLKHHKSFGEWESWTGIITFNPYGSKTNWYMYEYEQKIKCFSIDAYITNIDKMEIITFSEIKNDER